MALDAINSSNAVIHINFQTIRQNRCLFIMSGIESALTLLEM